MSVEIADVRRRVRAAIQAARVQAQERRTRADQAAREYETFLPDCAVPVFQAVRAALVAEGHPVAVFTPASGVRLAVEGASEDFIELGLDTSADPPVVVGRVSRGRGRRMVTSERPVAEGVPVGKLTEDDVLTFLVTEIVPLLER